MDQTEKLFKKFTEAVAVSGCEGEVFNLMEENLAEYADIKKDRLGSFIARLKGRDEKRPRVMIAAHMDEVGMMVSRLSERFIKFNTLGGWWPARLVGLPVVVRTGERDFPGVVSSKSPFFMEKDEKSKMVKSKDLYVDIGLTGDKTPAGAGVRPGDPIVPSFPFTIMEGDSTYMAKAWDDRAGCVAVVEILKRLGGEKTGNTIFGVGTVQEEVGLRGAVTSGYSIDPDVCLVIDVGIAQDIPGSPEGGEEKLGKGASICVYDATLLPNMRLRDLAVSVAEEKKISYHYSAVPFGGTDGGKVHLNRMGVPTLVISLPTRYIHSAAGIIHRKDYDSVVKLVGEMIRRLDSETVDNLV